MHNCSQLFTIVYNRLSIARHATARHTKLEAMLPRKTWHRKTCHHNAIGELSAMPQCHRNITMPQCHASGRCRDKCQNVKKGAFSAIWHSRVIFVFKLSFTVETRRLIALLPLYGGPICTFSRSERSAVLKVVFYPGIFAGLKSNGAMAFCLKKFALFT